MPQDPPLQADVGVSPLGSSDRLRVHSFVHTSRYLPRAATWQSVSTSRYQRLMRLDYLAGLFEYDTAVSRELLTSLRGQRDVGERTRSVFAHILAARKVWIERLRDGGRSETLVWPTPSWDECEVLIDDNDRAYKSAIGGMSDLDLDELVAYQNSKGETFVSRRVDILMHVLLHGSYHRGQVAQSVRRSGGEPTSTDYIFYLRE